MSVQNKVCGVVLAGGMARRMQQQDKGLVLFKGKPLITYPLAAISPLVVEVLISANRNQAMYAQYADRVISDETPGFDGPLAGILAAMRIASQPLLLVAPCDTPLLATEHFQRLLDGMKFNADAAIAFDGERLHPVMMVVKTAKQENLAAYLESGERKMQTWLHQLNTHRVDFSDAPQIFANINTLSELQALEAGASLDVSD